MASIDEINKQNATGNTYGDKDSSDLISVVTEGKVTILTYTDKVEYKNNITGETNTQYLRPDNTTADLGITSYGSLSTGDITAKVPAFVDESFSDTLRSEATRNKSFDDRGLETEEDRKLNKASISLSKEVEAAREREDRSILGSLYGNLTVDDEAIVRNRVEDFIIEGGLGEEIDVDYDLLAFKDYFPSNYSQLSNIEREEIDERRRLSALEWQKLQEHEGKLEIARLGGISYEGWLGLTYDGRRDWVSDRLKYYTGRHLEEQREERLDNLRKEKSYIKKDYSGRFEQEKARSLSAIAGPYAESLGEEDAYAVTVRVNKYLTNIHDDIFGGGEVNENDLQAIRLGVRPEDWRVLPRDERKEVEDGIIDIWEDRKYAERSIEEEKTDALVRDKTISILDRNTTEEDIRYSAVPAPTQNFDLTGRTIAFDIETTGLSPTGDRIVEIGAVELIDGVPGKTFQAYVNPGVASSPGAFKTHGLTEQFLERRGQPIGDVLESFQDFIGPDPIYAHNAFKFDLPFILNEARRSGIDFVTGEAHDTLRVSQALRPNRKSNLDVLSTDLLVAEEERDIHGALEDAYLLAGVMVPLSTLQPEQESVYGENQAFPATKQIERINAQGNLNVAANIAAMLRGEVTSLPGVDDATFTRAVDTFLDVASGGVDFTRNLYYLDEDVVFGGEEEERRQSEYARGRAGGIEGLISNTLEQTNKSIYGSQIADQIKADDYTLGMSSEDVGLTIGMMLNAGTYQDKPGLNKLEKEQQLTPKKFDAATNRLHSIAREISSLYIHDRTKASPIGELRRQSVENQLIERWTNTAFSPPFNKDGSISMSSRLIPTPNELKGQGLVPTAGSYYRFTSGYTPAEYEIQKSILEDIYGEGNIPGSFAGYRPSRKASLFPFSKKDRDSYKSYNFTTDAAKERQNTLYGEILKKAYEAHMIIRDKQPSLQGEVDDTPFRYNLSEDEKNREQYKAEADELLLDYTGDISVDTYLGEPNTIETKRERESLGSFDEIESRTREKYKGHSEEKIKRIIEAKEKMYERSLSTIEEDERVNRLRANAKLGRSSGLYGDSLSISKAFITARFEGYDVVDAFEIATGGVNPDDPRQSKELTKNYTDVEQEYIRLRKSGLSIKGSQDNPAINNPELNIELDVDRIEEKYGQEIQDAINPPQRSPAWHKLRRGRLTASNMSKLVNYKGEIKSGNIEEVSANLNLQRHMLENPTYLNDYMVMGTEHEDDVKNAFMNRHGHGRVFKEAFFEVNETIPGFGASPDGRLFNPDGSSAGLVEFKYLTNTKDSWRDHYVQMQLQLAVSKEDMVHYFALDRYDSTKSEYKVVVADKNFQDKLIRVGSDVIDLSYKQTLDESINIRNNTVSLKDKLIEAQLNVDKLKYELLMERIMQQINLPFDDSEADPADVYKDMSTVMREFDRLSDPGLSREMPGDTSTMKGDRVRAIQEELEKLRKRYSVLSEENYKKELEKLGADTKEGKKFIEARESLLEKGGDTLENNKARMIRELSDEQNKVNMYRTEKEGDKVKEDREERAKQVSIRNELQTRAQEAFDKDLASKSKEGLNLFKEMEEQGSGDAAALISEYEKAQRAYTAGLKESTAQVREFSRALKKVGGGLGKVGGVGLGGIQSELDDVNLANMVGVDASRLRGIREVMEKGGISQQESQAMFLGVTDRMLKTGKHNTFVEDLSAKEAATQVAIQSGFTGFNNVNWLSWDEKQTFNADDVMMRHRENIAELEDSPNGALAVVKYAEMAGDRNLSRLSHLSMDELDNAWASVEVENTLKNQRVVAGIDQFGRRITQLPNELGGGAGGWVSQGASVVGGGLSVVGGAADVGIALASAKYISGSGGLAGGRGAMKLARGAGLRAGVGGLAVGGVWGAGQLLRKATGVEDDGGLGDSLIDVGEMTGYGASIGLGIGMLGGPGTALIGAGVGAGVGAIYGTAQEAFQYFTKDDAEKLISPVASYGESFNSANDGKKAVSFSVVNNMDWDSIITALRKEGDIISIVTEPNPHTDQAVT